MTTCDHPNTAMATGGGGTILNRKRVRMATLPATLSNAVPTRDGYTITVSMPNRLFWWCSKCRAWRLVAGQPEPPAAMLAQVAAWPQGDA